MSKRKARFGLFNNFVRLILVIAAIAVQCWWFLWLADVVQHRAPWVAVIYQYVPLLIILHINARRTNSAFKMPWMVLIAAVPFFGVCMYLLIGRHNGTPSMRRKFGQVDSLFATTLDQSSLVMQDLEKEDPYAANQAKYLWLSSGCPVYRGTDVTFFDDADEALRDQMERMRGAKRYIFLEYFAIQMDGVFGQIKQIFQEKTREGVQILLLYDDLGSFLFQKHSRFAREMESIGVRCRRFNPLVPVLNVFMANRDHRKIMVIDGETAYTGGYNLADEYFHRTSPYGWWKDTGVRLDGEAVKTFVVTFLEMWNSIELSDLAVDVYLPENSDGGGETSYLPAASGGSGRDARLQAASGGSGWEPYLRTAARHAAGGAYVAPYVDSPLDDIRSGEESFMNVLRSAKKYVYFSTPYMILTDEMAREMTSAAARGIDVRVVVPGIPDKRLVYAVTRANFDRLLLGGVRIYRYRPGFNHAKECVSDDTTSIVGTINMDFRSFYHHFEDAVWIYDRGTAARVREDIEGMFAKGEEVPRDCVENAAWITKAGHSILRLLAPIL